jgi:hypothetical protein
MDDLVSAIFNWIINPIKVSCISILTSIYDSIKDNKYISSIMIYIMLYVICIITINYNKIEVDNNEINMFTDGVIGICAVGIFINIIHILIYYSYKAEENKSAIYISLFFVIIA